MAGSPSPRHAAYEPVGPATRVELGRLFFVVVLVGVGAGISGAALTLLLHLIQHLAFGYTEASFLTGVEKASGVRRVVMMTIGGLIAGLGWWALRSYRRVKTVTDGLKEADPRLPIPTTLADSVLQVVAVAFGGSLGREGAPRAMGGAVGVWIAAKAGLTVEQQRRLLACGAGAGLAAVYNVPLAGALFTLEILLVSFAFRDVLAALFTSAIAVAVAWTVLSNEPTYDVEPFKISDKLVIFGLLLGPIAGVFGSALNKFMHFAQSHPPTGWRLPVLTTSVFALVGLLAIPFPQLLGNGKGPAQLAFDGALSLQMFAILIVLKPLVTAACLRSGATGGTLTPSLAAGAMLGAFLGGLWSMPFPGAPLGAYAMIGASAVLATTHRAPFTAIVLILELTHSGSALLVPTTIAVVVAYVVGGRMPWEKGADRV
ncbi:MAG: chloride channel protein [Nocardiaceae bacterium]|nr:chloride channel protein [Nocardiaceae bacterium]